MHNDRQILLYENEESLFRNEKSTERFNLFLNRDISFNNDSFLTGSIFFQPSLSDFSDDYKYSISISYNFPVSEGFNDYNFKKKENDREYKVEVKDNE